MKSYKEYEYLVLTKDRYKVIVKEYDKGKFIEQREHYVDLRNGDWLCDCQGFHFRKTCSHIKFILSQLKDKGGILQFDSTERWQDQYFNWGHKKR